MTDYTTHPEIVSVSRQEFQGFMLHALTRVGGNERAQLALREVMQQATEVAVGEYQTEQGPKCPWAAAGFSSSSDNGAYFGIAFDSAVREHLGFYPQFLKVVD